MTPSPSGTRPRDVGLLAAGGWAFLVTAFVGRIPSSMVQLGYLLVLSSGGRGMAAGGLAVAAVGLGTAAGAPLLGRLVDRFGPFWVLLGATVLSAVAQVGFLAALRSEAPAGVLLACAGVVGAANPQIGPVARSRWSHLAARLGAPSLVEKALGYEGAVDELGFVIGPVVASALVTALGPQPAAVGMLLMTLVLQGLFLAHLWRVRAEMAGHRAAGTRAAAGGERVSVAVLPPMLGCLGVGLLFGATQTALTALFAARGIPGATGAVYACVGVGSGLASLLVGHVSPRVAVPWRLVAGGVAMAVGAAVMGTLPGAWVAALVALLLGCGAGVTLVSSFSWMERIAPRHLVATMMTVLATCITLGVSAGAALAGMLAADATHAFWLVFCSAALALLGATGMAATLRR